MIDRRYHTIQQTEIRKDTGDQGHRTPQRHAHSLAAREAAGREIAGEREAGESEGGLNRCACCCANPRRSNFGTPLCGPNQFNLAVSR